MMKAEVGDDVYGDDPTAIKLEHDVAQLTGKEAGLFTVTGTMANQLAIKSLVTSKHDNLLPEILCQFNAHVFKNECGGIGYHSRAQVFPIAPLPGKFSLPAEQIAENLHFVYDLHRPITAIISLEIPSDGLIMPFEEIKKFQK